MYFLNLQKFIRFKFWNYACYLCQELFLRHSSSRWHFHCFADKSSVPSASLYVAVNGTGMEHMLPRFGQWNGEVKYFLPFINFLIFLSNDLSSGDSCCTKPGLGPYVGSWHRKIIVRTAYVWQLNKSKCEFFQPVTLLRELPKKPNIS